MRYAKAKCSFVNRGDYTYISGPYYDDPSRERGVTVKTADLAKYESGEVRYIQDAFPYLSADDREFLISGMSPEGWDETFPEED